MKWFPAERIKGKLYVLASDVPGLVEAEIARRHLERPAEPDETVLPILAAARKGDATDLANELRKYANDVDPLRAFEIGWISRAEARRAAELLQSIADEN